MNIDDLRQTGRSTRLLCEAEKLASKGCYVFVIAESFREQERLRNEFCRIFKCKASGENKVYPPNGGQVSFENINALQFDWHLLRPVGCNPSCRVLIDHHAIEAHIGRKLLEELHRFDA